MAVSKFSVAKKTGDSDQKIKYFKILRSLFEADLELFKEVEKLIGFTGDIKVGVAQKTLLKRKLDQTDQ